MLTVSIRHAIFGFISSKGSSFSAYSGLRAALTNVGHMLFLFRVSRPVETVFQSVSGRITERGREERKDRGE